MGLLVKTTNQYKAFISKSKQTQNEAYLSRELRQTFIERRNRSFNGQLNTILTNKVAGKKKEQ
jgi:hypothetical protein